MRLPCPSSSNVQLIDVAREFRYAGSYHDFGLLSVGQMVKFAR